MFNKRGRRCTVIYPLTAIANEQGCLIRSDLSHQDLMMKVSVLSPEHE